MSAENAAILQPNDVSETINIPRKRGRPRKSECLPGQTVNGDTKQCSHLQITSTESGSDESNSTENIVQENDASENVNIPRKRGRPPKSKYSASQTVNGNGKQSLHLEITSKESNLTEVLQPGDASESIITPRKRGRPRKSYCLSSPAVNCNANDNSQLANQEHKSEVSKLTEEILSLNNPSESVNTLETKGRPQKSDCLSGPTTNCNTNVDTAFQISSKNNESKSKELKLFPIFKSHNIIENIPTQDAAVLQLNETAECINISQKRDQILTSESSPSQAVCDNTKQSLCLQITNKEHESQSEDSKVVEDVLQPNDASESINIPRKRGRPRKSECLPELPVNCNTDNNLCLQIANEEYECKNEESKVEEEILLPNDASECITIPRKRGRPRKSECLSGPPVNYNTNDNPSLQFTNEEHEYKNEESKLAEEILSPNNSSESEKTSKKRGRPRKSECLSKPTVNCNTKEDSALQISSENNESKSKELKFFPIFKSHNIVKNISVEDTAVLQLNETSELLNIPQKEGQLLKSKCSSSQAVNNNTKENLCLQVTSKEHGNEESKLEEVLQLNDASESINIPRKRGRPRKSDCLSGPPLNCNANENPCLQIANEEHESKSKESKLVGEISLPNNSSENKNTSRKRGRPRKSECLSGPPVNCNTDENQCLQITNEELESKNTSRKRGRLWESECLSEPAVNCKIPALQIPSKECESQDEKPKLVEEILQLNDAAESINTPRKRGRPRKSECLLSSPAVNCESNNCSALQITSKNTESHGKELKLFPIFKSHSKPQHTNNTEHVDKGSDVCNAVCNNIEYEGKMLEVDSMVNSVQQKVSISSEIERKNNTSLGDSNVKFFESKTDTGMELDCVVIEKESTQCANDSSKIENVHNCLNTDVDQTVYEVLQFLCLKTEQTVDSNDILISNDVEQSTDDDELCIRRARKGKPKKPVKMTKQDVSVAKHMPSVDNVDSPELSSRRRSLRSRGVRDNFINYSEIDNSIPIIVEEEIDEFQASESLCSKLINNMQLTSDRKLSSPKTDCDYSIKTLKESENVKDKPKFFPIFTSKKIISEENNKTQHSKKRKASCDEEFTSDNADISIPEPNKRTRSRNKKAKNKSTSESSDEECKVLSTILNSSNMKNENSDEKLKSKSITEKIHDNKRSKKSEIFSVSDTKNKISDGSHLNENQGPAPSFPLRTLKKSNKSDVENICFPLLSHLNMCDEALSDTVNKFHINPENSDFDITLPVWDKLHGFIDVDCISAINSKTDCIGAGEKWVKDVIPTSDVNTNENMLWTDSVQNMIMGETKNGVMVKEIKSWLLQWKDKYCKNSRRKKSHSDSDSFSSDSDSDDDFASNGIIIHGAPGSGKTNLVFSLANELGFTVLEVNASSSRNGRNISHQLKEALESYHVEGIKIENSFENIALETIKLGKKSNPKELNNSPGKSKKNTQSEKKKQTIANFFQHKVSDKENGKLNHKNRNKKAYKIEQNEHSDKKAKSAEVNTVEKLKSDKNSCQMSNLTIILFDDVDIVFEEDEGFWSTVKGFLKISKKPVIFTVGRNLSIVKAMLNIDIKIFNMEPTSKEFALNTLKGFCKEHRRENTNADLDLLTSHNLSDLRRNILSAQFWTQHPPCVSNEISGNSNKFMNVNSCIVGDTSFSTDHIRKLLFHCVPNYSLNAISQYQSLGYDVLYSNLFFILNVLDSLKCEKEWQTLSFQKSCGGVKTFSDSQMWEEACEIFKQKKKALQSGACSKELSLFANTISNFSFADMLKGLSSNKFQWISVSERIKFWTAGLPICCDDSSWSQEDILQIVSMIDIYSLRLVQNTHFYKSDSGGNNSGLILEHPYTLFDQAYAYRTEDDLKCLSLALPLSQQLNKVALTLDYLSMIKIMCQDEKSRQFNSGKRSGRFLHYFDSITFLIDKRTF